MIGSFSNIELHDMINSFSNIQVHDLFFSSSTLQRRNNHSFNLSWVLTLFIPFSCVPSHSFMGRTVLHTYTTEAIHSVNSVSQEVWSEFTESHFHTCFILNPIRDNVIHFRHKFHSSPLDHILYTAILGKEKWITCLKENVVILKSK